MWHEDGDAIGCICSADWPPLKLLHRLNSKRAVCRIPSSWLKSPQHTLSIYNTLFSSNIKSRGIHPQTRYPSICSLSDEFHVGSPKSWSFKWLLLMFQSLLFPPTISVICQATIPIKLATCGRYFSSQLAIESACIPFASCLVFRYRLNGAWASFPSGMWLASPPVVFFFCWNEMTIPDDFNKTNQRKTYKVTYQILCMRSTPPMKYFI